MDIFSTFRSGLESPAEHAVDITPSDSSDLTNFIRAIYVGTEGTLKVDTLSGDTVTFNGISGILPVRIKKVYATGTTATNLVGLY